MNQKKFKDYMESKNMKVVGRFAYGTANDFPVSVEFTGSAQLTIRISCVIPDFKSYRKELKDAGFKDITGYDKNHLSQFTVVRGGDMEKYYGSRIMELTSQLKRNGIRVPSTCPICSQAGCDRLAAYNEGYDPIHQRCLDSQINSVQQKAEQNSLSGNYFTGILGAIIGAIVGIIPSVFTIMANGSIYAILFALIPLAIYQGYKICRGKMNKVVVGITIVLSIFSVYLIEIVLLSLAVMEEYTVNFVESLTFTFSLLSSGEVWAAMTQDSISSFVFVALGIWMAWNRISRTAQTDVSEMELLRQTMQVYVTDDGYMPSTMENTSTVNDGIS